MLKPKIPCVWCKTPHTKKRYCSSGCRWAHFRSMPLEWQQLSIQAAKRRETMARQAQKNASRFPSKAKAYAVGYKVGYNRAYRYWRKKALEGKIGPAVERSLKQCG